MRKPLPCSPSGISAKAITTDSRAVLPAPTFSGKGDRLPSRAVIEQIVWGWRPPGKGPFWSAVRTISGKSPATLAHLIELAEKMRATDSDTSKDEQLALNYMRKKLAEAEKTKI